MAWPQLVMLLHATHLVMLLHATHLGWLTGYADGCAHSWHTACNCTYALAGTTQHVDVLQLVALCGIAGCHDRRTTQLGSVIAK